MSVSNNHDSKMSDVLITEGFRLLRRSIALADTAVYVHPADGAPVVLVTNSGTGPAVVRLPLAALDSTVFWVVNLAASTQSTTVTDDAGSPATINTLATDTGGMYMKVGATYQCLGESGAIA